MSPRARILLCLAALVAIAVAADGAHGLAQLAIGAGPLLVLGLLLALGRYPGESRVLRLAAVAPRRRRRVVRALRPSARAWSARPARTRTPWTLRGPPVAALAA